MCHNGFISHYVVAAFYSSGKGFLVIWILNFFIWIQEVDIWSFGCLILELLTLEVPYIGLSELHMHDLLQVYHYHLTE